MTHRFLFVLGFLLLTTTGLAGELRFVPQPKTVQIQTGTSFALNTQLELVVPELLDETVVKQIQEEVKRLGFAVKSLIRVRENDFDVQLVLNAKETVPPLRLPSVPPNEQTINPAETYTIVVNSNGIYAKAGGKAGLMYAVQTIRQLLRANVQGGKLPNLEIQDWPSLQYRCFMDDWTRGPSPKRSYMLRYMDMGTEFKHNMFTYYMESQFRWKKHPEIAPKDGAIDIEDLKAAVEFAQTRHLEILGNQQSFGHSYNIFKIPGYENLGEAGYILSPAVPRVYDFLDDIYAEVLPELPFEMFNVCCDEVYDLGKGPSKELVEKIGAVGVYLMHVQKVHELLKKRGKRMMMWGDIIMNHEDRIKEIPADTVVLCWDYAPRDDFDAYILPFSKSGFEFFVCPGISNWSRMLPDFKMSTKNIKNFVRDGVKYGALGMINTCWEDDGESLHGYNSYGIAWGGECAWTGSTTDITDFNRRIGAVLFGEKRDHFGTAIELLEKAQESDLIMNGRFWANDFAPQQRPDAIREKSRRILESVQPAIEHLEQVRKEATANADLLDSYILGAKRMEWVAKRMFDGLKTAELYQKALESETDEQKVASLNNALEIVLNNRKTLNELKGRFIDLWNTESQPYALDWTLKRYKTLDDWFGGLEQRLQKAIESAKQGKELPSSEEMGIPLPGDFLRNTKPAQYRKKPLFEALGDTQSDLEKWLVADAPYRIGIEVGAGPNLRTGLPLELDIPISGKFKGKTFAKPVRVFWFSNDHVQEIPGQISFAHGSLGHRDPTGHFCCIIPGVRKDQSGYIYAYFGGSEEPGPEVSTIQIRCTEESTPPALHLVGSSSESELNKVWLENNHLRLMLSPEGGHVYHCELKALNNRDLTFPGETDWFGFADTGFGHRNRKHKMILLGKGPAMVRCGFLDRGSLVKTITLWAGTNWFETVLAEPTGYYWDFDNPENFAADSPTPGTAIFSNGHSNLVARSDAPTPAAQVFQDNTHWAAKYVAKEGRNMILGLATPGQMSRFGVGPGGGSGGIGIEQYPGRSYFVTFAGMTDQEPAHVMEQLSQTLDLRKQPRVILFEMEQNPISLGQ